MLRHETELTFDIYDLIAGFPMPVVLRQKFSRIVRRALDEAYAQGRLDGTKETCVEVKRQLASWNKPDTYPSEGR